MLTQNDATRIAKKLDAEFRPGRKHTIASISFDGKYVGSFGIRHASKDVGHTYIPRQLFITQIQAHELSDCSMSKEAYFQLLKDKGKLASAE